MDRWMDASIARSIEKPMNESSEIKSAQNTSMILCTIHCDLIRLT